MIIKPLRDFQQTAVEQVFVEWEIYQDLLLVLPTGAGKTRVMAEIVSLLNNPNYYIVIQVHRKELISQIAMAMAEQKIEHRFEAQKESIQFATKQQMKKLGYSMVSPSARVVIASSPTLAKRNHEPWHDKVTHVFTDEGHHLVKETMWGTCRDKFPNAKGLSVTATPKRADGRGLGRHASGYADKMIIGPDGRHLIGRNFLSNYRLIMAETDIDMAKLAISSATGDFTDPSVKKAMQASDIVGETVETWQKHASGMLTVVFSESLETCEKLAQEFRKKGIPAEAISSKNTDEERAAILDRFERKKTLVLINMDLFGEGFDCPAIECVIMDRPTQSYSLFCQQFGRALRWVIGKTALIIDKVGNVRRFIARGFPLPDTHYEWSLDDENRKSSSAPAADVTTCTNKGDKDAVPVIPPCGLPYPAGLVKCPFCGFQAPKVVREGPDRVEGNLIELTPEELEQLRRAVVPIDRDPNLVKDSMIYAGAPKVAAYSAAKNIRELNEAQIKLRNTIAYWAGYQKIKGLSSEDSYKYFYTLYQIDVLSSQALGAREATELNEKITQDMTK